jgi:hypothetical protein
MQREKEEEEGGGVISEFLFFGIDLNVILILICLERFHELDKRCREFENTNNELKQLNTQLEKDLLSVGGVTELFRRGPEVCFCFL